MDIKKIIIFIFLFSYLSMANALNVVINNNNNLQKVDNNVINFTEEEKVWLENNPIINIATMLSGKYDDNGNNIHTDLLQLLNKYGKTNFSAIKFPTWSEAFNEATNASLVFGILNLSWTIERSEKYFNYSKSYSFDPLFLVVKDTNTTIKSLKDLENKTIYANKKSSVYKTVEHFTTNVNAISYSNKTVYKNLSIDKNISAFLTYRTIKKSDLKKYKLKIVKIIYNKYGNKYFGISKNHPVLHSIVNKIFAIIPKAELANLRNKVYKIHKTYKAAKNKKSDIGLSIEEKKWISKNTVSIGVEDWSPVVFLNTSLKIDGIAGDFMNLIIKKTGLKVNYISNTWGELLKDFKDKKIDILPATYYTKDRTRYGLYSKRYFKIKDYLYVRKDNNTILSMKDLEGKTLAMELGSGSINKIKNKFPKIKFVYVKSLNESIDLVLNKKADALFDGQIVIEKKINDEFILGLKGISQTAFPSPTLHIISNISKPILASIIQKGLKDISTQTKVDIANKWLQTINNDISTIDQINKKLNKKPDIENASLLDILSLGELLFSVFILSVLLLFIYSTYSKSKILNISMNRFILLILVFELSVVFFLIYEIVSLDRVENKLALVYRNKTDMIQVMQKLRQSSDDLSNAARAYAVRNDDKFKKQYFDILDIRNGLKARPEHYNLIYWDLSKERREHKHKSLRKESLKSMINELPFNSFQKDLLKRSEYNSNDLVSLEKDAFKAMENGNQKLAIKLLYSKQYYKEKEKIMIPLDTMALSMYKSMDNQISFLNYKIKNEFIYIVIVGIFFILGNFIIYLMIIKKITKPLSYLSNLIDKFKKNKTNIIKETFYKDEIGDTIQQFFNMKASIEEQQKDLEETHRHTKESIEYSSLIQRSIIPSKELFAKYFKDYFVIWNPKDIVGGDIYLFNEISEDECIFMIIDCTGHGVPGAFVTMLVKALEREIFSNITNNIGNINTAYILKKFNKEMKSILKQDNNDAISNAGFDGAILYYNKKEKVIKFSGANNELFIVKDDELSSIKGNRHSIGYRSSDVNYEFTEHIIDVEDNMKFYITTDGYLDQNGGEKGFPFGKKRFKNIIQECNNEEFINQQEIFLDTLYEYQGKEETNDDITLISFKI